jgi:DmsE family decaheme c-type cytochrome
MINHEKPSLGTATIFAMVIVAASAAFLFAETASPVSTSTAPAAAVTPSTAAVVTPSTAAVVIPPTPAPVQTPPIPAEVKPAVAAPAPSPSLDYVGASTCLSCHQNQEHFKDTVHARAFAQLKGIEFEKSCETCHGPGSLHAAAAGDRSNPGFATIKNFKGKSAVELEKTCFQCHEDENRMHWVGSVHEKRNVSCLACHSVHNVQEDNLLLVKPTVELVCNQCHQDVVAKVKRSAHMPVEEGKMDCSSCHNPHGSATPKMLKEESVTATCYTCHADKRGPFVWEHPPVREDCLNCHDPHGSHNDHMLVARLPFLCQRCHIASHSGTAYDQTSINAGSNKIMGGSCTNCHSNIHGSNSPSGQTFQR